MTQVATDSFAAAWTLYTQGQVVQAEHAFTKLAEEHPAWGEALHMRGVCLLQLKQHGAALPALQAAAQHTPQDPSVHSNLGLVLRALKRHAESLAAYDRALQLKPDFAQAWANRGNALRDMGQGDEAISSYQQALQCQPQYAQALHGLGLAYGDVKRWSQSLAAFDAALLQKPDYAVAYMDRGNTLRELDRVPEALQSYERSLQLNPQSAQAWSNRGVVLKRLGRMEDAAASYERAIALDAGFVDAMVNYATLLKDMMRLSAAVAMNGRALEIDPDNSGAHLNLAICHLVAGAWSQGWSHYEWRWKTDQLKDGVRTFAQPQWRGEPLEGKTILLHAEQGLGDTLQFCRFTQTLAVRGARVLLEVQAPLVELLASLPGVHTLLVKGQPLPAFDVHCPLLSIPLALGLTLENMPPVHAYLRADPVVERAWALKAGSDTALRVGVVWSGRPEHKNDHNRSIPFAEFQRIFRSEQRYHCLQKEFRAADLPALTARSDVAVWDTQLQSFSDTAALIAAMDLVVSVDTSVAHLAAAMGKPVWLLLPFSPDWRWVVGRDDSPWYPRIRLFRQPDTGQWAPVLAHLHQALGLFTRSQET
nr:tetratricopeptide repeat protein [uncultured Rhodoferax sp.]